MCKKYYSNISMLICKITLYYKKVILVCNSCYLKYITPNSGHFTASKSALLDLSLSIKGKGLLAMKLQAASHS